MPGNITVTSETKHDMKKLPLQTAVHVDGPADQFPFERTVDDGIVIGYHPRQGYLIALKQHRENLYFKRRDLSPVHGG
jgi:hypothetical protein